MVRINCVFTLFVSLVLVLNGCGRPAPGHKIHRNNDTLLVFLALNEKSEIVDTFIENNELLVDIKSGEKIEKRKISLKRSFMGKLIAPDETLEIHGTDRINGYGIVQFTVTSPNPRRFSMSFTWSGIKVNGLSKKPGAFGNSGSFRDRDRIIAYCMIPDSRKSSWKYSKFGITVEVTDTVTFDNVESDADGNRILEIETDDSDMPIQNLRFLLKDLQPDETVEVENKSKLGDDIFIAHLKVIPKKDELMQDHPQRNLPTEHPNLIDR